jgi:uncharacterized protein
MNIELEKRDKIPKKKFSVEQILTKLRQIEVLLGQGKAIAIACKEVGTTDKSSGMNVSMVKSSTASRTYKLSSRTGASTRHQACNSLS